MDAKDRLAYEVAMATLQDTKDDCLRSLEDQEPVVDRRPSARRFGFRPRATPRRALAT